MLLYAILNVMLAAFVAVVVGEVALTGLETAAAAMAVHAAAFVVSLGLWMGVTADIFRRLVK